MFDFEFYFPATGPFLSSGTVTEYKVTIILVMFAHILLDKDSKPIAYDTFYETGGIRRPRDARSLLLSLP
ncbi:hypothetical protein KML24009_21740 [Alistipes putredinis]|jgi:hypothetical protein